MKKRKVGRHLSDLGLQSSRLDRKDPQGWRGYLRKPKNERFSPDVSKFVPGALNVTEKIRKAGADMFANVGPEKREMIPARGPQTNRLRHPVDEQS